MGYILLTGLGLGLFALLLNDHRKVQAFLAQKDTGREKKGVSGTRALNLNTLAHETLLMRLKANWLYIRELAGQRPRLKLVLFVLAVAGLAEALCRAQSALSFWLLYPVLLLLMSWLVVKLLQKLDRRAFDTTFPDALNLLNGAISAGESLMQGIIFVGNSLECPVGREFKRMGQHLSLGQSADEVFQVACRRFPFPAFYFFVITLRANINRGGQLKEIINRLNRVMFNSRAIEKKKYAMTAEARASAKIVAAIPFLFMVMMKVMSPDNFNFVFYDKAGQPILYYVLASEAIGLGIIWGLMKRVQL